MLEGRAKVIKHKFHLSPRKQISEIMSQPSSTYDRARSSPVSTTAKFTGGHPAMKRRYHKKELYGAQMAIPHSVINSMCRSSLAYLRESRHWLPTEMARQDVDCDTDLPQVCNPIHPNTTFPLHDAANKSKEWTTPPKARLSKRSKSMLHGCAG